MPDIAKCANSSCPRRTECYRYTSQPSPYWQVYGEFEHTHAGCDYFISDDESKVPGHDKK